MINQGTAEYQRLSANAGKEVPLEQWGPYLSERQWGTVREDYSTDGQAWQYFPHDHARSRVYRWGEDGLGGLSDINQQLCFAPAFWNGKDPILKERLFGLSNPEGNHGEDVKELYYYLDNLPTHYYMKFLYKYPHTAFPYEELVEKNRQAGRENPEYEILDTEAFTEGRYFDIFVEYAKNNSTDIFIKIEVVNRGPETAPITVLPTLWFYNYWQYNYQAAKPCLQLNTNQEVKAMHPKLGAYYFYFPPCNDVLFTENETNYQRLFGRPNKTTFVKDAFHEAVIKGENFQELKDKKQGTKCAPVYHAAIASGASYTLYFRLTDQQQANPFAEGFENLFKTRQSEADEFYNSLHTASLSEELKNIQRQAFAGMLWSKQFYHYDLYSWLNSDDGITPNTDSRKNGRNHTWTYLKNLDILSMPDNWEYPWYAAWDMAFHCITMALIDPIFAKHQLTLMMREWYMDPQGQLPAYEWNFSDVNPPVQAFAALQVYHIEEKMFGKGDLDFLKRIFQKLIINFTWWTNRKDANGNGIFEGGFLGLDNIGIFNRSADMPEGMLLEQADGTSWMGMYALDMMNIALQIAIEDPSFEDAATKFYEHFVIIAQALNELELWNKEDDFFYDALKVNKCDSIQLKVRSIIGLTPLFAVSIIDQEIRNHLKDFTTRMRWFHNYRKANNLFLPEEMNENKDSLLVSLVTKDRLQELVKRAFDETEFLAPGGIRALSRYYEEHPYSITLGENNYSIHYTPGESDTGLFGGNSNWRGPVWMPMNYLLIGSLSTFAHFFKDELKVEFPTGSGKQVLLTEAVNELKKRLLSIFIRNEQGERPVFGKYNWFYSKDENKDLLLFHEYFHGDNSMGLGASHQTGWTALIANLIMELEEDGIV